MVVLLEKTKNEDYKVSEAQKHNKFSHQLAAPA
jgi:hypothetical protein